ncbi:FxLYD domain-containing protein [Niallia taxi]|uniref:FxLYD domain-containing protein n=1 Tax=Niallia taxi TaxID=2499688 RepID=UPI00300B4E23
MVKNLKVVIPTVIITALIVALASYLFLKENKSPESETVNSEVDTQSNVEEVSNDEKNMVNNKVIEITDHKVSMDGNFITIKGSVKNNSSSPVTFVKLKVNYMDENNKVVNTEEAYVNSSDELLPDEQKSFNIMTEMIDKNDYKNYELNVVEYKK